MLIRIYILISFICLSVWSFGQVRIVNSTTNAAASSSSSFIDASSNNSNNLTANIGKGLVFPRTDLTSFNSFSGSPVGIATSYPTRFDGMIVYNTGTGVAGIGGINVTPGFYYYSNKTTTTNGGQWVRLTNDLDLISQTVSVSSTPPAAPVLGTVYFNTTDHQFYECTAMGPPIEWTTLSGRANGTADMELDAVQLVTALKTFSPLMLGVKGSAAGVTLFESANSTAVDNTLTLPAITGTLATLDGTETLTNKTIDAGDNTITGLVNSNIDANAAISGTKINPDFGDQTLTLGVESGVNVAAGKILLHDGSDDANSGSVSINAPSAIGIPYNLTLPNDDGSNGQLLQTDGAGNLSWTSVSAGIDAKADGSTKGIATFKSSDFDDAAGVISLDYANGQKANALDDGFLSSTDWNKFNSKESALTFGTGLSRTANAITSDLHTGKSGGQTITGGTAASETLTLTSTDNATKGKIIFGTSVYNESNNRLGIGTLNPTAALDVVGKFVARWDATIKGGDLTLGVGTTAKQGAIIFHDNDANDSFSTTLQANADVPADFTLTLPADAGSSGQVLQTDGSGNLSWTQLASSIANGNDLPALVGSTGTLFYESDANQMWVSDGTNWQKLSGGSNVVTGNLYHGKVLDVDGFNNLNWNDVQTAQGTTNLTSIPEALSIDLDKTYFVWIAFPKEWGTQKFFYQYGQNVYPVFEGIEKRTMSPGGIIPDYQVWLFKSKTDNAGTIVSLIVSK